MPVETNVQGLQDLNENWPLPSDLLPEANEHLQNLKKGLHGSFAHIANNGGVVTVEADELNQLSGVTSNVQTQLNAKPNSPVWTTPAFDSSSDGITQYNLVPNTRILVDLNAGDSTLRTTLPLIADSSDGDVIEIKSVHLTYVSFGFEIDTQLTEQMRALDSDGSWRLTQSVIVDPVDNWPHVQCTFQAALGNVWVVRVLDATALVV